MLVLAIGDLVAIVALIVIGQLSHDIDPVTDPLASLESMVPFLIGWLVISLLAGVYAREIATSVARAARSTTVAWIAAVNVGLIIRSTPLFDGGSGWPFNLVLTGSGLVILLAWRLAYASVVGSDA
ncbi:hypothetical protein AArc1_1435 [Natrarchaeobaculum sulfurireducens]|uniref:DUF3054 domain-containing protein n=1 Tax=Natrarchaeobaculum sulfurireducens TaxID=2044521 RepID=A0A346PE24_9EURY|nr:hypothetical protein AArc1_1435 [Natrarchaeobaculum sulfurireducens]